MTSTCPTVNPIDAMKNSRLVAADTMAPLLGQAGVSFISIVGPE